MTKITPLPAQSTTKSSFLYVNSAHHTQESQSEVSNFFENEDTYTNDVSYEKKRRRYLNCPIRVFLLVTLLSLILVCAVTIYLAVFVGLYSSVDELTTKTVTTVEGQVKNYIDRYLISLKMSSNLAASHYNNALVSKKDFRKYLFQAYNNSGTFVGYFFYINNKSERYSYTLINGNLLYTYQENGFPGLIRDRIDITTSKVIKYNFSISTAPQNLSTTPFFTSALAETRKLNVEGVFGSPFYNVGGAIGLPYSSILYDPTLYPDVRKTIGVCRVTVPLYLLSEYLSKVSVFQKGYVLLTEMNSTYAVAGSIQTTTDDASNNLSLFNLTEKNAGQLMKDISEKYNGFENLPPKIFISSKGVRYIITISTYQFDDLVWRLFIVAYDDDINFTTNLSIGISLGVSIIIVFIGFIYSLVLSRTITSTIKYLEEQLLFVKTFDLDKVTLSSSIFKEMNQIIDNLDVTVLWLKQVKSFIPATVFYQIKGDMGNNQETNPDTHNQERDQNVNKTGYLEETHTNYGTHSKYKGSSSSFKDAHANNSSLFKLGLNKKTCCIIHIMFNRFELENSPQDISITFSKVSTMIRNIANMYQAHFQINSTEDIVIVIDQKPNKKHPSELAVECVLKVYNVIMSTNSMLKDHDNHQLDFFIGVSTNVNSFVGNLGSQTFRFYSYISNSRKFASNLAILGCRLGVRILIDEETFNNVNQRYVTKPVDRICMEGCTSSADSSEICNVYELIKEKAIAQDEWLYELNSLNLNKEIDSLNSVFSIFKEASNEKSYLLLEEHLASINKYLAKFPNDPSITNLLSVLEYHKELKNDLDSAKLPNLNNYCKKIEYEVTVDHK